MTEEALQLVAHPTRVFLFDLKDNKQIAAPAAVGRRAVHPGGRARRDRRRDARRHAAPGEQLRAREPRRSRPHGAEVDPPARALERGALQRAHCGASSPTSTTWVDDDLVPGQVIGEEGRTVVGGRDERRWRERRRSSARRRETPSHGPVASGKSGHLQAEPDLEAGCEAKTALAAAASASPSSRPSESTTRSRRARCVSWPCQPPVRERAGAARGRPRARGAARPARADERPVLVRREEPGGLEVPRAQLALGARPPGGDRRAHARDERDVPLDAPVAAARRRLSARAVPPAQTPGHDDGACQRRDARSEAQRMRRPARAARARGRAARATAPAPRAARAGTTPRAAAAPAPSRRRP